MSGVPASGGVFPEENSCPLKKYQEISEKLFTN
jgi:hypothetical protein